MWSDERHRGMEVLQRWQIEVPLRWFAKTLILAISYHSDDFDPRCRRGVAQPQTLADRAVAAAQTACKCFVHDSDRSHAEPVLFNEIAAG